MGNKAPWFGKKLSSEHKNKLSMAHKGQIPWNKGKKTNPLSTEHKKKIADAMKIARGGQVLNP